MDFGYLVNIIKVCGISMTKASDYVYYLKIDGELIEELIFSTEELAIEFAKESNYETYEVIEWDVN